MSMEKRIILFLCIFLIVFLGFDNFIKAFYAELAIYSNPALSPDESQVAFECRIWNTGTQVDRPKGESDIFLVDIKGSGLRQLTFYVSDIVISPDKSKILLSTTYGLYLLDLNKISYPRQVFDRFPKSHFRSESNLIRQLSWSPNSKKFFFARIIGDEVSGERIYSIIDAESLEEMILDPGLGDFEKGIQWIDDNTIIYEKDNEILVYNYISKKGDLLASGYPFETCTNPVPSPDMQKLLYRYKDQIKVRFGPPHKYNHRIRPVKRVVCQVKDLPDWASDDLTKRLWSGKEDILKKTDYLLLDGSISDVKVSWFGDSQRLLIKGQKELWIYNLSDSSYTPVFLDSIPIKEALITPDQKKIYFISTFLGDRNKDGRFTPDENFSDLKVYDFEKKECRIIFNHSEPIYQLRFSYDGSSLALVKDGNIWILNTETEETYQLTFNGGVNPQWLKENKILLFSERGSLVRVEFENKKYTYLTLGRGVEPNWLDNKEVILKSGGKYWKVSLDKFETKETKTYPVKQGRAKGEKYEVYVEEIDQITPCGNLTEVRVKDIKTQEFWTIKRPWCNGIWD